MFSSAFRFVVDTFWPCYRHTHSRSPPLTHPHTQPHARVARSDAHTYNSLHPTHTVTQTWHLDTLNKTYWFPSWKQTSHRTLMYRTDTATLFFTNARKVNTFMDWHGDTDNTWNDYLHGLTRWHWQHMKWLPSWTNKVTLTTHRVTTFMDWQGDTDSTWSDYLHVLTRWHWQHDTWSD